MTNAEFLRRALKEVRPYWPLTLLGVVAMAVTAATEPTLAAGMKWLLDEGFKPNANFSLWLLPVCIVGLFLVRGISTFASNFCMQWLANRMAANLRLRLFSKAIQLPSGQLSHESCAKYVSLISLEVMNMIYGLVAVIPALVRDGLVILGLLAWLIWLNWKLTLITLAMLPIVGFLIWISLKRIRGLAQENVLLTSELAGHAEQAISNQKVVKIYGGFDQELGRFGGVTERIRNFMRRLAVAQGLQAPATQLIASIALSAVVVIAIFQARADQTTIGGFVSFVTAMLMLLTPLKHIADVSGLLQRAAASGEAVYKLMDQAGEVDSGTIELGRCRGDISFHDVSFTYPGAQGLALKKLNFSIPAGSTLALVGPSGGGKSSISQLIPRFYDVSAGQITLDGIPLEDLTLASLRANIAMVNQEVMLFNASIAENIAYGTQRNASMETIRAAAKAAYLDDFVQSLPEGYDTVIGERGAKLSGGQRQRLAIARALLKDAPILILDEATSALDTESERHVQQALERLMFNRTTLVIAHRLSTVQHAQQILVLSDGAIVERGNHQSLLDQHGLYAGLYRTSSLDPEKSK